MHYKALTPSPYLAAGDLGGPDFPPEPTFEIVGETFDQLPSMKPGAKADDKETKGMIRLRYDGAITKPWIANKTNMELIAAMFGPDTDGWKGKRVTLCTMPIKVGPKNDVGIRVKGSPDLTAPKSIEIKFRGRKAETFRLVPTGNGSARGPSRSEHDIFLDALATEAGYNREHIAAFLTAQGLTVTDRQTGEALWPRLQAEGDLWALFGAGPGDAP